MRRFLVLILYLALGGVALGLAAFALFDHARDTRGIETDFPATQKIIGTNVALEQYATDAALQRAFDALQRAGVTHARQYFYWRAIETTRGEYAWAPWDRIVNAARANGIELVAVLTSAPAWSQRAHEREMPNAPPDDFAAYARFVGAFARRYGETIDYYQIWDEPNVEPNWGKRNADAMEYAQLLMPAAQAIRAQDADAQILLAGLAMNLETHRPHPNYSEILFLRGLYESGAQNYFDIVAAKPYGMWTGPEDRTVNSDTLNFSRLILLREEMRQYGDKAKPVWAVELGWNALPPDWTGEPSPWGTDVIAKQSDRLARGLARLQTEWAWVTGAFPNYLQPNVPQTDPRWGFTLLTRDGEPNAFFDVLQKFNASPPAPAASNAAPYLAVALLLGGAVVAAWRAWHWTFALRVDERWRDLKTRVNATPELAQLLLLGLSAAAFYFSPNAILNFVLLAALGLGMALRLDFAFGLIIFTIPFWNYPKNLFGGFELSPVEVFTWAAAAAFALNEILEYQFTRARALFSRAGRQTFVSGFDVLALAFFLLGLASTRWAGNFGVASREFRVVILDPLLLYALLRMSLYAARENSIRRLVWAWLASGAAVCVIGLYQFFTGDVILAEGVARLTAVWGSPNNVALYLGRLLPLTLAFALLWRNQRARWAYGALGVLFGATIALTYSRGALLLGVPTSVLFVAVGALWQGKRLSRRAWILGGAILVGGALALLWFATTERFQSLFQTGTGTGFFRVAVWTSAVEMLRDHPLLGVGLDNFLYEYPKYILPDAWREPNLSHPHNFVLDFWTRLGFFGVLLLGALAILFFRRAWNDFKTTEHLYARALLLGLMASMVNFLAHGLIDAAYFYVDLAYVFWLTLFLVQAPNGFQKTIDSDAAPQ